MIKYVNKAVFVTTALVSIVVGSAYAANTNTTQTVMQVDTTNNRVSIGIDPSIASPTTTLEVSGTISASNILVDGATNTKSGFAIFSGGAATGAVTVSDSSNLSGTTINHDATGQYRLNVVAGFCDTTALEVNCSGAITVATSQSVAMGTISTTQTSATASARLTSNSALANPDQVHCQFKCR